MAPTSRIALHELGQNGWELVAVIPETRIFTDSSVFSKRPLADSPARQLERVGDAKRLASNVSGAVERPGLNRRDADSLRISRSMT